MQPRMAALSLLQAVVGSNDASGQFLVKAAPRVLQDDCPLPVGWPQPAPGQALTEYFTCLATNCHNADATIFDGSGLVTCIDVVSSPFSPCDSMVPGIDFSVSDLCPEQCDRQCTGAAGASDTTAAPISGAAKDWAKEMAKEALKDQVVDGVRQIGDWRLSMSMNTDQSDRDWFHLNGGEVVDLGISFLEDPLLAVKLSEEGDPDKAVLVGTNMGCRNWQNIFAHPRIEDSTLAECKEKCLSMGGAGAGGSGCSDFSYNADDLMCETWNGTCIGWRDAGWSYYTFADKPFRPNFKSVADNAELTVSFWLDWDEMEAGETILVSNFFQFEWIKLAGGQINAKTKGGDTVATFAAACGSLDHDSFHQIAFTFSKSSSSVIVFVDGSQCATAHINWVDDEQGRDFGLPEFGHLNGVVTGFKVFNGAVDPADLTKMYEDMSAIYAGATYTGAGGPPIVTTAAPVITAAPIVTTAAPIVTAAPLVTAAAPIVTTAAPIVTAPPVVSTLPPATVAPIMTTPPPPVALPTATYPLGQVTSAAMCATAASGTVQWCVGAEEADEEESCDDVCASVGGGGCMEECWLSDAVEFKLVAASVGLTCSTTQTGGAPYDPSVEGEKTVNCGISASTAVGDCSECEGKVVDHQKVVGRCGVRATVQMPKIRRVCPCGVAGNTCGFTKTV